MFITDSEAMMLEYRAIKCLKQGKSDFRVAETARAFAILAIRRLLEGMRHDEAKNIAQKLLDTNSK